MATGQYILFPGRHHVFTRFQWNELDGIAAGERPDVEGRPFERAATRPAVVVAITSANHSNTRRNPVPVELRAAQAHLAASQADLDCMTVSIADVGHTDRFAEHVVAAIEAEEAVCTAAGTPLLLTPENCVVASSTPSVAGQFARLGYRIFAMEHPGDPRTPEDADVVWSTARPWELVESVAADGGSLAAEPFAEHVHPASRRIWTQHRLGLRVAALFGDPIVGADSDLTSGRNYLTYMQSFDRGADRKWSLLEPHVEPGRIVDIGCATGAILALAGRTARLAESDLIGIELSRALYDECLHRRRMGAFANENTFFYHRNAIEQLFAPQSVDTTMTVSLTHEIVSYLDESALTRLAQRIFEHTASSGVWLIYDVCAPREPDRIVRLQLDDARGTACADAAFVDHTLLDDSALATWLESLSVRARFDVFCSTFRAEQHESFDRTGSVTRNRDGSVDLRLADAMDFLAHHTYTESWRSEMNERFAYRTLAEWTAGLAEIGFAVEPASRSWVNPWLAEHRFAPVARMSDPTTGDRVEWGETNLMVVARRP